MLPLSFDMCVMLGVVVEAGKVGWFVGELSILIRLFYPSLQLPLVVVILVLCCSWFAFCFLLWFWLGSCVVFGLVLGFVGIWSCVFGGVWSMGWDVWWWCSVGFRLIAEASTLNSWARSSKILQCALAMRWVSGGPSCVYVGGFLGMKSIGPAMRSCVRLKGCNGHLRWGFFCVARAKRSCLTYLGTCVFCAGIHSQISGEKRQSTGAREMTSSGCSRKRRARYVPSVFAEWALVLVQSTCINCQVGLALSVVSHGVGGATTRNSLCFERDVSLKSRRIRRVSLVCANSAGGSGKGAGGVTGSDQVVLPSLLGRIRLVRCGCCWLVGRLVRRCSVALGCVLCSGLRVCSVRLVFFSTLCVVVFGGSICSKASTNSPSFLFCRGCGS